MILPDYLAPGLLSVVCGTAAGRRSAELGRYYAGPGNRFWPVLYPAGVAPMPLSVGDEARLLELGVGLTDVSKTASGGDAQIPAAAYDPARLAALIARWRPQSLAFNGKNAARRAFGRPLDYGATRLGDLPVWVLPSTSGAARGFWDERPWRAFGDFLNGLRRARA